LRTRKKFLAIVSTVTLVAGISIVAASPAHAALPKHDASNDTVECFDIIGKIKFLVPLTLGGTTPNQVTLSIKSLNCVSPSAGVYDANTNPTGIAIKQMSAKGILNSTQNDCLGLSGLSSGTSGNVTMKWSMVSGTPGLLLPNNTTTLGVTQTWGGQFNDGGATSPATASAPWTGTYGWFAIGTAGSGRPVGTIDPDGAGPGTPEQYTTAPTVSGAFTGGTSGANTIFQGATVESSGTLANACFGLGIKGITFSIGYVKLA
jgi:hypothetical protein